MKHLVKYIAFTLGFSILLFPGSAQQVRFIPNAGQWDAQVLYKADVPGGDIYITATGLVYNLYDGKALHEYQHHGSTAPIRAHAIFLRLLNSAPAVKSTPYHLYPTDYNFYYGSNPEHWATGLKACRTVVLENVYPGIDFEISGADGGIKTAFIVKSGGDRSRIAWHYSGADQLTIADNALLIKHSLGEIRELEPVSYISHDGSQEECPTAYVLTGSSVSYSVQLAKPLLPNDSLVIDPSVVFSTFSGSAADNFGFTATFDGDGNAYSGGTVYSVGFPVNAGAYQVLFGGGVNDQSWARDAGILKYSPDGKQLLYATYLGGSGNEQPHSMMCDRQGNLFVMGTTTSPDFPVQNGFDMTHNGGYDVFVSSLSPDGKTLNGSTYIGGSMNDGINGREHTYLPQQSTAYNYGDNYRGEIRLDDAGNPYVATVTFSNNSSGHNLPLVNPVQPAFGGGNYDGWVFKMNRSLSQLLFSTYLGSSGIDAAYSVRVVDKGFYVAGGSSGNNLPMSQNNPPQLSYKGQVDGFIARFVESGPGYELKKTVYLGNTTYDQIYFVTTDKDGMVYVTGQTASGFARIGNTAFQNNGKHFISILNPELTQITAQTVFGAGNSIKLSPSAFMVDKCYRIFFSGWGGNANKNFNSQLDKVNNLSTTADALQRTTDGSDFYLIVFNRNLFNIAYATYYGGPVSEEHVDGGTSHFDEDGVVYQSVCAGCGGYSDFPTTPDAYSRVNRGRRPYNQNIGGCNNALFKISAKPSPQNPGMRDTVLYVTLTDTIDYLFTINDPAGDSVLIRGIDGSLLSLAAPGQVSILGNDPGLIRLRLHWIPGCLTPADTFIVNIRFFKITCEDSPVFTGTIKVIVRNIPSGTPDLNCLKRTGDSEVNLSWKTVDLKYLTSLTIFQGVGGGPLDSLMTLTLPSAGSEVTFAVPNATVNNYCYRITAMNRCMTYGNFSRQTCLFATDSIDTTAYSFSRDTLFFVHAMDTLESELRVLDNVFSDSLFLSYNGALLTDSHARVSHLNGSGTALISLWYRALCHKVGDTVALNFGVRDNQCPTPVRDVGRIRLVILPARPSPSNDLLCLKYLDENTVSIRWDNSKNSPYTQRYALIRKAPDGRLSNMGSFGNEYSTPITQSVQNPLSEQHCFALVSYNFCNQASDTGSYACTPWADSLYPPAIYPHYVTVANNEYIELSWPSVNEYGMELYSVDRSRTFRQLLYTASGPSDTSWADRHRDINVHRQSYCYTVEPVNDCGLRPKNPPHACSILLTGRSEPFAHHLSWTEYDYFFSGTSHYSLEGSDLADPVFTEKGRTRGKNQAFTDMRLNKETGIFHYQVSAMDNQALYSSLSNTIELRQKPLLHVPNAYSPNGDGVNDTWNIVPVFVKDYHLRLFDRWGRLVYETTDKHEQLGATDRYGNPLICDAYVYVVTYTGFSNEVYTVHGNLSIIK